MIISYINTIIRFIYTPEGVWWSIIGLLIIAILFLIYLKTFPFFFDVKIENFYFTWFCAILYFIFFICSIIALRILQLQNSINLIEIKNKIIDNYTSFIDHPLKIKIIFILLIMIVIICWLLIFIDLNTKLKHKVWQLFFYYLHILRLGNNKYEKFTKLVRIFYIKYDFVELVYFMNKLLKFGYDESTFKPRLVIKMSKLILTIIIPIWFILECYLNNFNLHYIFYYLLFFFISILYINITNTIIATIQPYPAIFLIERYYGYPNILYLNIEEETEKIINVFIYYPPMPNAEIYSTCVKMFNALVEDKRFIIDKENKIPNFMALAENDLSIIEKEKDMYYYNEFTGYFVHKNKILEIDGKYFTFWDDQDPEIKAYYNKLCKEKKQREKDIYG